MWSSIDTMWVQVAAKHGARSPMYYILIMPMIFALYGSAYSLTQHTDSLYAETQSANDSIRICAMARLSMDIYQIHTDSSQSLALQALREAEQRRFSFGIASAQHALALVRYVRSNYSESLRLLSSAQLYAESNKLYAEYARIMVNMARVYNAVGASTTALELCYKALSLTEQIASPELHGLLLNTLGNTYREMGNLAKAHESLSYALQVYQRLNNQSGIGIVLANLGTLYRFQMGRRPSAGDTALMLYQQSRAIREALRDTFGLAITYSLIALTFDQRRQYDTAEKYYTLSIDLKKKNKDLLGLGLSLNDMSKMFAKQNMPHKALDYAHQALRIASGIQSLSAARSASEHLVALYRMQGNNRMALQLYDTVMYYSNALIVANKEKEYARMEAVLKLENSQKENELLRTQQKLQESELKNNRLIISVAVIGGLFAVLIMLGTMTTARRMREANEQLHRQQDILLEQEAQIRESNYQLQNKNTLLADALKEKEELIGIVAHDLKNPLTGIVLTVEMLEKCYETERLTPEIFHKNVQSVTVSIERMQQLIGDLLIDHAAQSNMIMLSYVNVDLLSLLRRVITDYEPRATQKGMSLVLSRTQPNTMHTSLLFSGNMHIYTDERVLYHVIENLLSNAIKYSRLHSTICIECWTDSMVHLAIHDEGEGISEQEQARLFQRFTRLSTKPTAGEESTGLGLSIVKRYLDLLGGSISVQSTIGKGSVFTIHLPYTPL